MSTHLVIGDPHAHYKHNNDRAIWLGELINDIHPDVVINLGDSADMPSLSSYEKGQRSFQGRSYAQDISAHADFQDKLWTTVKKTKKRLPRRIALIGNHEYRIERAINLQPELEGTISYDDLALDYFYDEVVHYVGQTPGITEIDGVFYAHYIISGIQGRPVSGEHPAYSLLTKGFGSSVAGHSHTFDYCRRTDVAGKPILGLVAGCFFDYEADWAGECNKLYWRGVCILRDVDRGNYSLQQVSIQELKETYGRGSKR